MVKCKRFFEKYLFFIVLLAAFGAGDLVLSRLLPDYLVSSGRFWLNDYEITRRDHPEEVWDRVFFGNSVVISGYREDLSESGYINLGLDYGVVTDLWAMLRKGIITVGDELVVGVNDMTLYDDFATNPTYPWHRGALEPYVYFERDHLRTIFTEGARQLLEGFTPSYGLYASQTKSHYYGAMSLAQLEERSHNPAYYDLPLEVFQENFRALAQVSGYCRENGIRLRLVWMPQNPAVPPTPTEERVHGAVKAWCEADGAELLDLASAFGEDCFYDTGHMNYEYGSYIFTKEIDPWLNS